MSTTEGHLLQVRSEVLDLINTVRVARGQEPVTEFSGLAVPENPEQCLIAEQSGIDVYDYPGKKYWPIDRHVLDLHNETSEVVKSVESLGYAECPTEDQFDGASYEGQYLLPERFSTFIRMFDSGSIDQQGYLT